MNNSQRKSFTLRWALFNFGAWTLGFALFTPIGHGVTGNHGRDLSLDQIIAHSVGLSLVALLVSSSQIFALRSWCNLSWIRIPIAVVAFNVAFWLGYYQSIIEGPDTDILLGFLVLGCVTWIGRIGGFKHPVTTLVALISFPIASFVGEVLVLLGFLSTGIEPDIHHNLWHHSLFWIVVGMITGGIGGFVSGKVLSNLLPNSNASDAESPRAVV